jgi:hypothetical protein
VVPTAGGTIGRVARSGPCSLSGWGPYRERASIRPRDGSGNYALVALAGPVRLKQKPCAGLGFLSFLHAVHPASHSTEAR